MTDCYCTPQFVHDASQHAEGLWDYIFSITDWNWQPDADLFRGWI